MMMKLQRTLLCGKQCYSVDSQEKQKVILDSFLVNVKSECEVAGGINE